MKEIHGGDNKLLFILDHLISSNCEINKELIMMG